MGGLMAKRAKQTISIKYLESLKAPENGRREVRDSEVPGLTIFITVKAMSFHYKYVRAGRQYREFLGTYVKDGFGLAEARGKARSLRTAVTQGHNPVVERKQIVASQKTVSDLAASYIRYYAKPSKRSWEFDDWLLGKHVLPYWEGRKVVDIGRADVSDLLKRIYDPETKRGAIMANRARSILSSMFMYAVTEGVREDNPVTGSARPQKRELARDFEVTDTQRRELYAAIAAVPNPQIQAVLRLLMLTGARFEEIRGLVRKEIDWEGKVWMLPAARSKNRCKWLVPLTPEVLDMLRPYWERAGAGEDYLIVDHDGQRPSKSGVRWSHAKFLAPLAPGLRLHDFRSVAETWVAAQRVPSDVRDLFLNHKGRSVTDRHYNRSSPHDEHRAILEKWARFLTGKTADVIELLSAGRAAQPRRDLDTEPRSLTTA
jgi:integrase